MRIRDTKAATGGGTSSKTFFEAWGVLITETDLAVGVALVNVCGPPTSPEFRYVQMTNISTAGQNIRVGVAPQFGAPAAGTLLAPGQGVTWTISFPMSINAIADAAGGNLNIEVFATNQ